MRETLKEIFGRGYDMSYRWYRICEMFIPIHKYYELTVIPAIVLGCLTSLVQCIFSFIQIGIPFISIGDVVIAFIFFLVVMTFENVWDWWISAMDRVGWPVPTF